MLYDVEFENMSTINGMGVAILDAAHTEFSNFTIAEVDKFFEEGKKVLLDLKGLLNHEEYEATGNSYWRLYGPQRKSCSYKSQGRTAEQEIYVYRKEKEP